MSDHSHADYAAGYPAAAADVSGRPGTATADPGGGAPAFPRHVVTAVLVSHDGERWLPDALAALTAQERPVQNVIAADTGSADGSARILTEALGAERVLHLARRTGFGTAAAEAARTAGVLTPDQLPYLRRPSGWDPVSRSWRDDAYDMPEFPHGEPVQWLWLLHDDCAAEPDALAALLRLADDMPSAAIVGPKLRSWYDRRQLLETGVSIAHSGRRWTGIDRREQDQGQHDGIRDVLSVSTAGMLIRRDVFDQLGGFDARLPLMRDDVDLCWRAHKAGHRVVVQPDAVMRHAEAAARERRSIDCIGRSERTSASPHRVDKSGAAYTLLVNSSAAALPYIAFRLVLGTLLRTLAYLVGKVPRQALDEVAGLGAVLLRPHRIAAARRRRGKAAVPPGDLKPLFPGRGATVRATVEQVLSNFSGRSEPELSGGGRHGGAVESGPGDDDADFLEVEQFARLKRVARKPGPVLFAVLLLVALIACRELIGGGSLVGGALLPAPADAGDLWSSYADSWHPVGTGGTQDAPPYLAFLAGLGALLFGSTNAALTLLLVCSVPLAGFTAYFASRPLVSSRLLRAWVSVAYAFLPAATGALAAGRIGTAVLAVLLPLIARAAVAASGLRGRASWRGAWAYALLLTVTAAFTPVVWPLAALLAAALLGWCVARGRSPVGPAVRQLAVLVTPVVLLAPWSLELLTAPSRFFTEAGLTTAADDDATPLGLLLASPGGPNAGGGLLLVGVVLAALAALLRSDRVLVVRAAWAVAVLAGLLAAAGAGDGWTGPQTLVYGLALLAAAAVGADGARQRVAEQSFGWRQPAAVLVAAACAVGPLALAAGWMWRGADGPLERGGADQVPAFVAEESRTPDQPRTLVVGGTAGEVEYMLVRGAGARLGDAELAAAGGGNVRLSGIVAGLVAGSGADQSTELGEYAVRYVLVRNDAPRAFARVLDATPGLTRLSQQDGGALWRVDTRVSRATVVAAGGGEAGAGAGAGAGTGAEPVPVAAGPVEVHTDLKDGPEGRVLRLADEASAGWRATLDGEPLPATTLDGWAQGFELPAGGGRLDVTYDTSVTHTAWTWARGAALLVVLVLALPGRRRDVDDDLPDAAPAVPAQAPSGDGRRARRLRAAAAAEAAGAGVPEGAEAPGAVPEPPAMPPVPPGAAPGDVPGAAEEQPAWAAAPVPGAGQGEPDYGDPAVADPYAAPPQGYEWDGAGYGPQYGQAPYEAPYEPQYDAGAYAGEQQPGTPAVPQQGAQDPYGTGQYPDPYYDPQTYGAGAERDGSDNA